MRSFSNHTGAITIEYDTFITCTMEKVIVDQPKPADQNSSEATPLYTIQRGSNRQIRIAISEYRGNSYFDIRNYYLDKKTDSFLPTQKGITIPVELYIELLNGLIETGYALGHFNSLGILKENSSEKLLSSEDLIEMFLKPEVIE